jgi:hypothetical protein
MKIIYGKAEDAGSEFLMTYIKKLIDLKQHQIVFSE